MPKLSVIVPIYNVTLCIEKCVRSLLEQTLEDIEYLFIDDCTPDNSIEVLRAVIEQYPERKPQTCIIRMPSNGGLAAVRLCGVKEAKGDFIIHCDSDDWVDKNYYQQLYEKAIKENADIIVGDFIRESKCISSVIYTDVKNPPIKMLEEMQNNSFYCMLWNKMMRRSLLVENNIFAKPGINMWEDVLVCLQAFYFAKRIAKIEGSYYHYWINPTSYTANSANECSYQQRKYCVMELEKFFADKEGDWSLLLNYWKLLAKSFMLTQAGFNPDRWKHEYPEANKRIMQMKSIPIQARLMYKVTSITTLPIKLVMKLR